MHRQLLPVALAALLVLAGCLGGAAPGAPNALSPDGAAADGTVVVTGEGVVEADPDLAVVSLTVLASADEAADAQATLADRVADVRDALADAGASGDAVTTAGYAVTPDYRYDDGERVLLGYRAVHSLRVEAVPDDAGAVVDAAVPAGATVDGVTFTLADDTRSGLRADALALAVDNARADAEAVAGAADLTLSGVESATVGASPVVYARTEAVAAGSDGGTSFAPGPVSVRASVTVRFGTE
jgi:uncharacterized protein YggE